MNELARHRGGVGRVVDLLLKSRSLLFVTGAGVSADSGLPTYRGVGGLYDVDTTSEGLPIEEILSGEMLQRNPELSWKYLRQIAQACGGAQFNRAHAVLAEMERHFDRVWVVTQNIDGLHHSAGSSQVIDLHGDLRELKCTRCEFRTRATDDYVGATAPRCPRCHAIQRPDVVLFGESLPREKIRLYYEELRRGFDVVFSIGTSSLFDYVAFPIEAAKTRGRPTIEINPGMTAVSHLVDIKIPLRASIALDEIWEAYCHRY